MKYHYVPDGFSRQDCLILLVQTIEHSACGDIVEVVSGVIFQVTLYTFQLTCIPTLYTVKQFPINLCHSEGNPYIDSAYYCRQIFSIKLFYGIATPNR